MNELLKPKTIRLSKPNGEYYVGVIIAADGDKIHLYVLKSNIDGQRGITEKGTQIHMALDHRWVVTEEA